MQWIFSGNKQLDVDVPFVTDSHVHMVIEFQPHSQCFWPFIKSNLRILLFEYNLKTAGAVAIFSTYMHVDAD